MESYLKRDITQTSSSSGRVVTRVVGKLQISKSKSPSLAEGQQRALGIMRSDTTVLLHSRQPQVKIDRQQQTNATQHQPVTHMKSCINMAMKQRQIEPVMHQPPAPSIMSTSQHHRRPSRTNVATQATKNKGSASNGRPTNSARVVTSRVQTKNSTAATTGQKKIKSTSCMRSLLVACTTCKSKGDVKMRTKTEKSPPQHIYSQRKPTKLFSQYPHASAAVTLNTEPASITECDNKPRLLQPASLLKHRRMGSPPLWTTQQSRELTSKSTERKKKHTRESSARMKTFSSDLGLAQSLRQSQAQRPTTHRNVAAQTTLKRLKTAGGLSSSNSQINSELNAIARQQLEQHLQRCASPCKNELQSEPFEISPLRTSNKKKSLHQKSAQRLQPNYPVIDRVKNTQFEQHQRRASGAHRARISAEYAVFSVNISQEQVTTNLTRTEHGQDDDIQQQYDRSLLLQPDSETDKQFSRRDHSAELETSHSNILAQTTAMEQTGSVHAIRQAKSPVNHLSVASSSADCTGLATKPQAIGFHTQKQSIDSLMRVGALEEEGAFREPACGVFKTPDNYASKLKVAMITLSGEHANLRKTEQRRHSKNLRQVHDDSDLEQGLSQLETTQINPLESLANQEEVTQKSSHDSTVLIQDADLASNCRSSRLTVSSRRRQQENVNCIVQTNIIDICIRSNSDVSLPNKPSRELVSNMLSKSSESANTDNTTALEQVQIISSIKTDSTIPRAKQMKNSSFLAKAATQNSNKRGQEKQKPHQALPKAADGSLTFRETQASKDGSVKPTKRRTSSQHNIKKSMSSKGGSRYDLKHMPTMPLTSALANGITPGSPILTSSAKSSITQRKLKKSDRKNQGSQDCFPAQQAATSSSYMSPMVTSIKMINLFKKTTNASKTSSLFANRGAAGPSTTPAPVSETDNYFNKSNPYAKIMQEKFSPRRRQGSAKVPAKATTTVFQDGQIGASSEEQVIIEPDIPLPNNIGISAPSNVNSNNPLNFPQDTSADLSHSQVSILYESKSSAAIGSFASEVAGPLAVKKMTANPSLRYHVKPQMVQPSQKYEVPSPMIAKPFVGPLQKSKNDNDDDIRQQSLELHLFRQESQEEQKTVTKSLQMKALRSAKASSTRTGSFKSPLTARVPQKQLQNKVVHKKQPLAGKKVTGDNKFNPRETIAFSDAQQSNIQPSSSSQSQAQQLFRKVKNNSAGHKTPQSRSTKLNGAVPPNLNNQDSIAPQLLAKEEQKIFDIRLERSFVDDNSYSQAQPRTQKSNKSKVIELSIEQLPPSQDPPQLTATPQIGNEHSPRPSDQPLSSRRTRSIRSGKQRLESERSAKQATSATQFTPQQQQNDKSQNSLGRVGHSSELVISSSANDESGAKFFRSGAGQQAMKQNGGFQKLEQMDGDDTQSDGCVSLSQFSSQHTFDFAARLAYQSQQQQKQQTKESQLQQQLMVTKVVKRRCPQRYHSLEFDNHNTREAGAAEPASQMDQMSFGSLSSARQAESQKSRSLSQKKRILFSKFLTTSAQGVPGIDKNSKLLYASQNQRSINEQEVRITQVKDSDSEPIKIPLQQTESIANLKIARGQLPSIDVNEVSPIATIETEQQVRIKLKDDSEVLIGENESTPTMLDEKTISRRNDDITPNIMAELLLVRTSGDPPSGISVSKIFSQVERSGETNLLDNLSRMLDKNNTTTQDNDADDLLASQNLLMDSPVDEIGLLDDGFEAEALLFAKEARDSEILLMLDDPLNDMARNGPLSTPNNKEERKNLFTCEPRQNNFLTPELNSNGTGNNYLSEEMKSSTQKITRNLVDLQGNLSIISEEKSIWLQDSVSAASSSQAKRIFLSATMSSAFNSARKLSGSAQQQLVMQRITTTSGGLSQYMQSAATGEDKPTDPDSPFSLEQDQQPSNMKQLAATALRLNRQQSDCSPFPANVMNESADIEALLPLSARTKRGCDPKSYSTEIHDKKKVSDRGIIRRVSTDGVIRDFSDSEEDPLSVQEGKANDEVSPEDLLTSNIKASGDERMSLIEELEEFEQH